MRKKRRVAIICLSLCFIIGIYSGCQKSAGTTTNANKETPSVEVQEESVEDKAEDVLEDILDCISDGNIKVKKGIDYASYGSATTYEEFYDECCQGVKYFNEANPKYKEAIDLCGDYTEYATLKKRLQSVVDSVPAKPTAATDSALDNFGEDYSKYIKNVANLEAETEEFTNKTGYIISHAFK